MPKLEKFLRRYTSLSAVIDMLRRRRLVLRDPQSWDDRNDSYFMALYKETEKYHRLIRNVRNAGL